MKKARKQFDEDDTLGEAVEMAGWGVEEATEKNERDASKLPLVSQALFRRILHVFDNNSHTENPYATSHLTDTVRTGLATTLALAYAIHKSFIFIRVPLTAAVTPKVVKMLRSWGWDIGKRTTKEAKALKRASLPPRKPRARFYRRKPSQ